MYNPNIPQGDDSPKNQAPLIQTDFAQFASVFANNHTAVNTKNQGDHETVILQNQTDNPTIDDTFACLYSKNASSNLGTQPQLFLRIPVFLPNKFVGKAPGNPPMQLTYNQVNTAGPIYQSFLPGGYLIFWGATTIASPNLSKQITLPLAPTSILVAIAYPNTQQNLVRGNSRQVSTTIDSNTKFTIYTVSLTGSQPFNFFVVATV